MWRSAVQVCLGLHIAVRQCGSKADVSLPGTTLRCFWKKHQCVSGSSTWNSWGGLAQLARALAWHARGHRFDPDILHFPPTKWVEIFDILTHKTVSKEFKLLTECFLTTLNLQLKVWANEYLAVRQSILFYGERKLGRLVDALALAGDEGRDKLR